MDMSWYILKIEAVKIGDSPVAPLFSVIAGPSQEGKETGKVKKDMAERHIKCIQFWEGLLPVLNERTSLYRNVSPSRDNWLAAGTGVSGIYYYIVIRMNSAAIKLVIGKDKSRDLNKRIINSLYEKKDEIEQAFGNKINWRRMDNQISSRIEYDIDGCGLSDESTWEKGYERITETLVKWDHTFRPYLCEIRKNYKTFEVIQQ